MKISVHRHSSIVLLPLRAGLVACALASTLPNSVQAQAPADAQVARFNIGAGPLDAALNQFGRQSGVMLSVDAELTKGKTSPGVHGARSPDAALQQLLLGTGLTAARSADGSYSLRPQHTGANVLPTMKIKANAENPDATEGTGSYTTAVTRTATKLALSPRETPQTVTVITRQFMDDQGLRDIEQALQLTPGVYVSKLYNQENFEFTSRGYEMQTQYDGIPYPFKFSDGYSVFAADSAVLDRIEVQQGAAGLLSGAGKPGGTVNFVSKMPRAIAQSTMEVSIGSWNTWRIDGDSTGPMNDTGSLRGRLVGSHQENESFVDDVKAKKNILYGVVQADVRDGTTLTAGMNLQAKYDSISDVAFGIPQFDSNGAPLDLPRSKNMTADWASDDSNHDRIFVRLDQTLPNDWKATLAMSHNDSTLKRVTTYLYFGSDLAQTPQDITVAGQSWEGDRTILGADLYLSGPFELFSQQHEAVFGFNGSESREHNTWWYTDPLLTVNIHDYDAGAIPDPRTTPAYKVTDSRWKMLNAGVYAAGRFSLGDNTKLIVGARSSRVSGKDNGKGNGLQVTQDESGEISPYAGLVYDINDWASVYVSYSDIFEVKTTDIKNTRGSVLVPTVGANQEFGFKGEFFDGRLNAHAAVFRLDQRNLAEDDGPNDPDNICGGQCYKTAGKVRSEGVDTGLSGEIIPGLQMLAGYSYVDHRYQTGDKKGERYDKGKPNHIAKLAAVYTRDKWSAGGNLRWQSNLHKLDEFWTYDVETDTWPDEPVYFRNDQKAYFLVGLNGEYRFDASSSLSLNIDNLFDEKYKADVDGISYDYGAFIWGAPRNYRLSYRYRF